MQLRKVVVILSILLLVSLFLPVASARPVCILKSQYVFGVAGMESTYSCNIVHDAILVSAGNASMDANIVACLKTSSGVSVECQDGCGYAMFLGVGSNVAYVTVKIGGTSLERPDCTPTIGTIEVQFGDTRDGGQL